MASPTYQSRFATAVAAAVGTAVVHAAHLAYTEWANRTKRPNKPSANWPWRITLFVFMTIALTLIVFCAVRKTDAGIAILDAVSVTHVVVVEHYIVSVLTDAPSTSGPKRCYWIGTGMQVVFAAFGLWQLTEGFNIFYDAPLISRAMFAAVAIYLTCQMTQSQAHMYLMAAWSVYATISTLASLGLLAANAALWSRSGAAAGDGAPREQLQAHALAQCVLGWLDSAVMVAAPLLLKRLVGPEAAAATATTTANGSLTRCSTPRTSVLTVESLDLRPSSARTSDGTFVDLEAGDVVALFDKNRSTLDLEGLAEALEATQAEAARHADGRCGR